MGDSYESRLAIIGWQRGWLIGETRALLARWALERVFSSAHEAGNDQARDLEVVVTTEKAWLGSALRLANGLSSARQPLRKPLAFSRREVSIDSRYTFSVYIEV